MSLVGYKSKNHPQQVGKRGARPEVDDRATTPEIFDPLRGERWWARHMRARFGQNWRRECERRGLPTR